MTREHELTMQQAFERAFKAEAALNDDIVPALIAAIGEEATAQMLREIADDISERFEQ